MKCRVISCLGLLLTAPTAIAAGVIKERMELSPWNKMSLGNGGCSDISLEADHILHANCKGYVSEDPYGPPQKAKKVQLDLNKCFVNNLGTLNRAYGRGGYAGSCVACLVQDKTLRCSCKTGLKEPELKTNFINLDDWRTILVSPNGDLGCPDTSGVE